MFELFNDWLNSLIENALKSLVDKTANELLQIGFHAEEIISKVVDGVNITNGGGIYGITMALGLTLVLLKFLKKGFDTYILWLDGDADSDPFSSLVNLAKAVAISLCFPVMYQWITKIVEEFILKLLGSTGLNGSIIDLTGFVPATMLNGVVDLVVMLVFIIMYFVFYIKFIMLGLELFILRCGVPLACVGIIDNNGGIWSNYFNKLIQCCVAVTVQIFLLALAFWLCLKLTCFWGVACLLLALRTPRFLQEFMVVPQSSNMNAAMHNTQMAARAGSSVLRYMRGR